MASADQLVGVYIAVAVIGAILIFVVAVTISRECNYCKAQQVIVPQPSEY